MDRNDTIYMVLALNPHDGLILGRAVATAGEAAVGFERMVTLMRDKGMDAAVLLAATDESGRLCLRDVELVGDAGETYGAAYGSDQLPN